MVSFPLALFYGSMGIRCDERRTLAAICTLVAGGFIIFYLWMVGVTVFCR